MANTLINGYNGSLYGGGGGGGGQEFDSIQTYGGKGGYTYSNSYTSGTGGNGANGVVVITYSPVTNPVINSITPSNGNFNTSITITGSQFINVTNVQFAGQNVSYSVTNTNQIIATIPNVFVSNGYVQVTNQVGNSSNNSNNLFTYSYEGFSGFIGF